MAPWKVKRWSAGVVYARNIRGRFGDKQKYRRIENVRSRQYRDGYTRLLFDDAGTQINRNGVQRYWTDR